MIPVGAPIAPVLPTYYSTGTELLLIATSSYSTTVLLVLLSSREPVVLLKYVELLSAYDWRYSE